MPRGGDHRAVLMLHGTEKKKDVKFSASGLIHIIHKVYT